jgi:hypothetical protein
MVVVFAKILCKVIVCRGETFKVDYKRLNRFERPKPHSTLVFVPMGLYPLCCIVANIEIEQIDIAHVVVFVFPKP